MLLPIEKWITESALPEESQVAFREAVVAFKAGAYRAALLFSYVAWGLALRQRILNAAGPPSGMVSGQWDNLLRQLRDEDRWDAQVFDCTQKQSPAPLFIVSEDVRAQVRYWRDRRNDCAHFKLNEISGPHVESFWAFVRSNLGRFMPRGSEPELIATILRHFDPNVTAPGTPLGPLVKLIPQSMAIERFKQFLLDAKAALTTQLGTVSLPRSAEFNVLLANCLSEGGQLGNAALDVMLDDASVLVGVVRAWPQAASYLSGHPEQVRRLWRQDLFQQGHMDLGIYAALLRNSLIPSTELEEANARAAAALRGDVPQDHDVDTLSRSGFFEALRAAAFEQNLLNQFAWGNANAPILTWYVERFPLDDAVTGAICDAFGTPPFPFAAEAALQHLFSANAPKRVELENAAKRLGKEVPAAFLRPPPRAGTTR